MALSSWLGSAWVHHKPPASAVSIAMVSGRLRRSSSVAHDVDADARPDAAAVLAHAPGLLFVRSFPRGDFERLLRQTLLALFLGVEDGEMLADDLVGLVAFDAPGAGVPARDAALRIEHVDPVVGHPADQNAELVFACAQRPLGSAG